ncbi:MazG nucleotide pyrophosphohydrolase domain-containing protein [Corynebacterium pseudogenitalium]|uniref:MazG nucleotide pyrophosphohydrolase domain-containing protein n=1 Tax=Corynebacterium pseudogenitalium TaxID=38303 RepID=UPI003BA394E5
MTILVLDPRWPDMLPVSVAQRIRGPVEFTMEVPVSVRWDLADAPDGPSPWLLTTNEEDEVVRDRIAKGEHVERVPSLEDPVHQAVSVMHVARTRGQWERSMTHETLLPYLHEETEELAAAITDNEGDEALRKELSDVLLQVLFHAEIAAERGAFGFAGVAQGFVDKMKARSPYLFDGSSGPVDAETQDRLWQEAKAKGN